MLRKSTSSSTRFSKNLKNEEAGNPTTLLKSPSILRTSRPPKPCTIEDKNTCNEQERVAYLDGKPTGTVDAFSAIRIGFNDVVVVVREVDEGSVVHGPWGRSFGTSEMMRE